ncbi:MAG: phenylalanine--tRNA ligase subunit beta [Vulcanimicrobiaceae bacterium]
MRAPIAWLREFVSLPPSTNEIADRLAMLGFPVDAIERRPRISGVVVGRITTIEKHPNADRLQVCHVDVGAEKSLVIATAATNVAVGQTIPVATIGAVLPHITIERRKMRGVESEGMMCSADELALTPEWFDDGIMQLDDDLALGTDVVSHFGLSDDVLDVEITSNRVDAMSMIGIARELAAAFGSNLTLPTFENPGTGDGEVPSVTFESGDCSQFIAQRFDRVTNGVAPAWMRIRLALAGQRPIDRIVDISNYVMLETGQPLHFYDAREVHRGHFIVRNASEGEAFTALDDSEFVLTPQALVIADEKHALGLAGLKGGKASAISQQSTSLILESATFNGSRIRTMSRVLGFRTDASSRHEKTLPAILAQWGAARAAQLLVASGAHAYAAHHFGSSLVQPPAIEISEQAVERILGMHVPLSRIATHLRSLGCTIGNEASSSLSVVPPLWRRDLAISVDLIEEIARIEGYDGIVAVLPNVPVHAISSAQYRLEEHLAQTLSALGYDELLTYSLHGSDERHRGETAGLQASHASVEVRNPLSEEQRYLRYTLAPAMFLHLARLTTPARVFEIGHVFYPFGASIIENNVLTFGMTIDPTSDPAWRDQGFLMLKSDVEALILAVTGRYGTTTADQRNGLHPGKSATLLIDGAEVATFGRVDPRLQFAYELARPTYLAHVYLDRLPDRRIPRYTPPSKFPSTYRDLALVVSLDTTAVRIEEVVTQSIGALCTSARVFDEYRGAQVGEGRKSLAVRIVLQKTDATITDEEADAAVNKATETLTRDLGATLRI